MFISKVHLDRRTFLRGRGGQRRPRWNHGIEHRERDAGAHSPQECPPVQVLVENEHGETLAYLARFTPRFGPVVRSTLPSFERRGSCVVMNSSSAGLPSCVARMPLTSAWTIWPGSVTRSP